jgi:hypothetical protein
MLKLALRNRRLDTRPRTPTRKGQISLNGGMVTGWCIPAAVETTSRAVPDARPSDLPTRDQVIELVHDLAISFATSPVATPRAALRRVYWCYRFLRRYSIPIQPIMTRALWHAGVVRYGEQGTSAILLNWVLARVREVEGYHVAKELLCNSRFRESRAERIHAWSGQMRDEEQAVLAMISGEEPGSDRESQTQVEASTWPAAEVDSLLTGNEETDRDIKSKIKFLESEPPDRPFWLPDLGTDESQGGEGRDGDEIRFKVKPLYFLRNSPAESYTPRRRRDQLVDGQRQAVESPLRNGRGEQGHTRTGPEGQSQGGAIPAAECRCKTHVRVCPRAGRTRERVACCRYLVGYTI